MNRGDFLPAMQLVDRQLQKHSAEQDDWHWHFLVLKGDLLARLLKNREALDLLAAPLPTRFAASDLAIWRKLAMGSALGFSDKFPEALRELDEAESLANHFHPELLDQVALRKGTVAFLQQDLATAKTRYSDALRFARSNKDVFAEVASLGSLGLVATALEHYDEAIDWNRAAKDLSESIGAASSRARIMGNMGWSFFEMGDYENARVLFQQAEQSSEKVGLLNDEIYWQTNLGVADYFLRDYASAEKESQKALDLARKMGEKPGIVECLNNLSELALRRGELDVAEKDIQEALQDSRSTSDHSGEMTSLLISGQIQARRKQYDRAEQLFTRVTQDAASATALRWEAEARLAKVYDEEGAPGKAESEYRGSIATLEAARHSIGQDELRLTFFSNAIEFYDDYVDFLVAHGRANDALKVAELSRATTLAEGLAPTPEHRSASQASLQPMQLAKRLRATLLLYWLGENHSYLWAITSTKVQNFQLPPSREIDPLVKSFRQAQADGRDVLTTPSPAGQKLYEILIAPARKLIPPGSRVIVLPDDSLYSLNFETLILPGPQPRFWIDDATISTANSLTLLGAAAARHVSADKKLLLVGDTLQASAEFPSLHQAPQEISLLEKYFPASQRTLLVKDKATPTAYLSSNPGDYAYLHFVTHGTASRTRPLESAVILSPEGDSYKLYARDIVRHHLNAQLVTISACNGSGTRAYSGEGLVGLSWAFLRAGAHNVIGALWEVSDTATPQLMDKLYDGLAHGQDPATALRNAKLALLHSDSPYKKPYYWAPFQLYSGS